MFSCWWSHIWEDEARRYMKKLISIDLAVRFLKQANFSKVDQHIIKESMYDKTYFSVMNVANKDYRDRDSFFALVNEERLDKGIKELEKMQHEGSFFSFLHNSEAFRAKIGNSVTLVAHK